MAENRPQDEDFADYVSRVIGEQNINTQIVSDRAARGGYKIARSYITKIIGRKAGNLTTESLLALAYGLNRSPVEVFLAAIGKQPEDRDDFTKSAVGRIWLKLSQLPASRREKMQSNIEALETYVDAQLARSGGSIETEADHSNGGDAIRAAK